MPSKESLPLLSEDSNSKNPMLVLGPLLAFGVSTLIYNFGALEMDAAITLGIALWTGLWWIFETVPIPVASLLPLSLLPLFGILSPKVVGEKYGHPLVLLLLGVDERQPALVDGNVQLPVDRKIHCTILICWTHTYA